MVMSATLVFGALYFPQKQPEVAYAQETEDENNVTEIYFEEPRQIIDLKEGQQWKVSPTVIGISSDAVELSYSSSDSRTVYVYEDGTIVPRKTGSAMITVSTPDGKLSAKQQIVVAEDKDTYVPEIVYSGIGWTIDETGHLTISGNGTDDFGINRKSWMQYASSIITAEVKVCCIEDFSYFFEGCNQLVDVRIIIEDESSPKNLSYMFWGCVELINLEFVNWDTSEVTNMEGVFRGCSKLEINISDWDTSEVTNMQNMFLGCEQLLELDLKNFDTSKVTTMRMMFAYCSQLQSLDISNWNTCNVTDMKDMFYGCEKISSLDVSNWNTSNVTDMSGMFSNCSQLDYIDVSNWDVSKVIDMHSMFNYCYSLSMLETANWCLSEVVNFSEMFYFCENLSCTIVLCEDAIEITCMFYSAAINENSRILVDYTGFCSRETAQKVVDTKERYESNVYLKGAEPIVTSPTPSIIPSECPSVRPTQESTVVPINSDVPSMLPGAVPSLEPSESAFASTIPQTSAPVESEIPAEPSNMPTETPDDYYNPPSLTPAETPTKAVDTLVWDGTIDTKWEGKGTKISPYLIYTPQEFAGMLTVSEEYKGTYYKLMNDIDLGGKPLRANNPDGDWGGQDWGKLNNGTFYGIFDGNYHLITGFYQKTTKDNSDGWFVYEYEKWDGLFGRIDTVSNVSNVTLCGRSDCGPAFASELKGVMNNCISYVDCYGYEMKNGMISEALDSARIKSCYNYGTICAGNYAGGIVGKMSGEVTISQCANFGEILQSGEDYYQYAGGIVGFCDDAGGIENCVNMGNVTAVGSAGGICGSTTKVTGGGFTVNFTVEECYNQGDITGGTAAYGIIGGTVNVVNCINKGDISSNGGNAASIGVGSWNGNISQCYSIADIDAAKSKGFGLADYCDTLSNCYYVGNAKNLVQDDVEMSYCKHWTTYPEDGIIDINGGDFDYFTVNNLSKCQNGFPVLTWEENSFNISEIKEKSATVDSISLRWSSIPRATGYEIYKCDENGEMELLDTVNANYYLDESLEPDKKYQYKVRAYITENGYTYFGEFTDVVTAFTLPEYILGDVDSDNSITLKDAQLVLKAALKIITFDNIQIMASDVDKNAMVELRDAQAVLKAALKIERLPVAE